MGVKSYNNGHYFEQRKPVFHLLKKFSSSVKYLGIVSACKTWKGVTYFTIGSDSYYIQSN